MNMHKTHDTEEAWETGKLGLDTEFAAVDPEHDLTSAAVDKALGLKPISIRLEEQLIQDFKLLGQMEGIGYQTLMRTVLRRFAESEIKRHVRDYLYEQHLKQAEAGEHSAPNNDHNGDSAKAA
ncbi:MAG: hypothetical protein FNT29_08805 [Halothiobacillaceae bacterium]|jgi:predicted DNA binding CopG/RHH family protein|nr:MAG: hypothetical protein FNT29_08805 [Halothiobacillaceae bacterium]